MKKLTLYILFVCLFVSNGWASYTYVIDSYGYVPSLYDTETLLMVDEGGTTSLLLNDSSSATILSTSSPLEQGVGGVWEIHLRDNSSLSMSGGQVSTVVINANATAVLTGGHITGIFSYQYSWKEVGDPPVVVSNPHITIVYSGNLPTWNSTTNILNGLWGNGDSFSIQLIDVSGYSPAIDNIQFILIPEPATLLLLGLGRLLIRRKQ